MVTRNIPIFGHLEIETKSTCNRTCKSCIRNSHPDRAAVQDWFEDHELSLNDTYRVFRESAELGFHGVVCLQHYNEPLQDQRIGALGRMAKGFGFPFVFCCTNGDFITNEMARDIDGAFDQLQVALYLEEPLKSQRQQYIASQFKKTSIYWTGGDHIPTHFSPIFDADKLANEHRGHPCFEPQKRMIINHRGDMLLCCDDMIGNFHLGNIRDQSIEELWFSDRHQELLLGLQEAGERSRHPYCRSCPRP